MNKTQEALKMAIEALEDNQHLIADNERHTYVMLYNSIIDKCKEALAQPSWQGLSDAEILDKAAQIMVERHYKEKNT